MPPSKQILKLIEQVDDLQKQVDSLKNKNKEKHQEKETRKGRSDEMEQYLCMDNVIVTALKTKQTSHRLS